MRAKRPPEGNLLALTSLKPNVSFLHRFFKKTSASRPAVTQPVVRQHAFQGSERVCERSDPRRDRPLLSHKFSLHQQSLPVIVPSSFSSLWMQNKNKYFANNEEKNH